MTDRVYAYLHGFASSARARKGTALREAFVARGHRFLCPDLNRPSFARLSHGAALAAVHEMVEDAGAPTSVRFRLIGSSLGGWLAARYAELHPDHVDRLMLLCPGFDLSARWPTVFGREAFERWQRDGELELADGDGVPTRVHFGFYEESCRQPAWPAPACPILIIHGTRDDVVPIESSRRYARAHPNVTLIEVDDDHALLASLPVITTKALEYLTT